MSQLDVRFGDLVARFSGATPLLVVDIEAPEGFAVCAWPDPDWVASGHRNEITLALENLTVVRRGFT